MYWIVLVHVLYYIFLGKLYLINYSKLPGFIQIFTNIKMTNKVSMWKRQCPKY